MQAHLSTEADTLISLSAFLIGLASAKRVNRSTMVRGCLNTLQALRRPTMTMLLPKKQSVSLADCPTGATFWLFTFTCFALNPCESSLANTFLHTGPSEFFATNFVVKRISRCFKPRSKLNIIRYRDKQIMGRGWGKAVSQIIEPHDKANETPLKRLTCSHEYLPHPRQNFGLQTTPRFLTYGWMEIESAWDIGPTNTLRCQKHIECHWKTA